MLALEVRAIQSLRDRLGPSLERAVDLILACKGTLLVTGVGKAGIVGQKLSATFASTGTPAISLHPTEALHGDLGRVRPGDLVVALSNSGETEEILRLVPALKKIGVPLVAITGNPSSSLARLADCVLDIGPVEEAGPLFLAPTASTTGMLALGDALAMVVCGERDFRAAEFAMFHPGGALGRRLMRVSEVMRKGECLPIVRAGTAVEQVLVVMTATPGRPGAAIVVDEEGKLAGFFTDGDLRRLLEQRREGLLRRPIEEVMTRSP
ncbi:MAG TPA: KpsF/GutQ family sugar-phosphate isomerase, partial [Planctomycetota bacterium]|nr:KpsF/GutQ family sugar-phosphate isomerase [Planctomycetota bacterium]